MPAHAIGPWPAGMDNVRDEHDSPYQVAKGKRARLVELVNCDLPDTGWPKRRAGTTDRRAGTDYRGVTSVGGLLLLQDGGTIYSIDPDNSHAATSVVTGLHATNRVWYHDFDGDVYYTNGVACGKITSAGVAAHWGLTVPSAPTVATSTTACNTPSEEALNEGDYLVAVTLLDANGAESGASPITSVSVDGEGSFTVTVPTYDSNAAWISIYISDGSTDTLAWAKTVAATTSAITVSSTRESTRPLLTAQMRGPVPGAGVFSHLGYILTFAAKTAYRSRGQVPNLFYPRTEVLSFKHTVRFGLGLQSGFYVGTAGGLYWISGSSPAKWKAKQLDSFNYKQGALLENGERFPSLKTTDEIGFCASEFGLIALKEGGDIQYVTDQRLDLSASGSVADLAYHKSGDLRRVMMCLQ